MTFQEFPKSLYNAAGETRVVNSPEEQDALGEGWIDGHEYFSRTSDDAQANAAMPPDGADAPSDAPEPPRKPAGKKPAAKTDKGTTPTP